MTSLLLRFHHQFLRSNLVKLSLSRQLSRHPEPFKRLLVSSELCARWNRPSTFSKYPAHFEFTIKQLSTSPSSGSSRPDSSKNAKEGPKDGVRDSDERAKEKEEDETLTLDEEMAQLSFYQRYKKLFKEYWYILLPVHAMTSIFWFGSSFLLAKTGAIDIVQLMEFLHVPDVVIKPLKNPNLGHFAVAAAFYKVVSPLRYISTVTITVPLIKFLVRQGKIRPVKKVKEIKKMIEEKLPRGKKKLD